MDPVASLTSAVSAATSEMAGNGRSPGPKLDRPPRPEFGDYSSNAAMLLAPVLGEPPRAVAERLGSALGERLGGAVERVEIAGPGFLNLFMTDGWYLDSLAGSLEAGEGYGAGDAGERRERGVREREPHRADHRWPPAATPRTATRSAGSWSWRATRWSASTTSTTPAPRCASSARRSGPAPGARSRRSTCGAYVTELADRDRRRGRRRAADELARRGIELLLEGCEPRSPASGCGWTASSTRAPCTARAGWRRRSAGWAALYESRGRPLAAHHRPGDDKDRVLRRSDGDLTYFATDIAYHAGQARARLRPRDQRAGAPTTTAT